MAIKTISCPKERQGAFAMVAPPSSEATVAGTTISTMPAVQRDLTAARSQTIHCACDASCPVNKVVQQKLIFSRTNH